MSIREKTGPQALEQWARNAVDGKYPGVSIKNMTTSWRNGLAFCALIHRFHPELIDFETLDPNDIRGNCTLAFEIAESKLGIPSLLDPEDFVNTEVPDRLSVLTYVAQIYNFLKNSHKTEHQRFLTSPEKVGIKRPGSQLLDSDAILESTRDTSPKRPVLLSSPAVCSVCQNPVYITERVLFAKKLFHRSCFRCTNCDCVLNPQTADYSPEGLFCLDKDCQKQFRKLNNSPSSRIVNNNNNNYTPSPTKFVGKPNGNVVKIKEGNETTSTPSAMDTTIPKSLPPNPSPILNLPKEEEEKISSPVIIKSNEIEEEDNNKDIPNSDKQEESQEILKDKNHIPQELNDEISPNQILSDIPDNSKENLVEDKKEEEKEPRETISQESSSTINELSEDRLNIEEIVEPEPQQHEKEKVRSVSFSAIVSVAKIEPISESDSTSNTQLVYNDNLSNIENKDDSSNHKEEMNETAQKEKDNYKKEEIEVQQVKMTPPPSPKPKPKNAIDFLKENLETMSAQKNPFEEEEEDEDNEETHKENNIIEANNYGDGAAALEKSRNGELELEEKTSRNESGVGDSFESEMVKNDEIESGDEDPKLQVSPISTHDIQHSKDNSTKEHTPNHTTKSLLNESADSLSGLEGQGEAKEEIIIPPVRRPRVPRSSSPANTTTTTPVRPSPSPRKRISTSELWKTKDYYPAELNPFESEDTFTLQPSDILVVKKASSHERLPPVSPFNPFEDDEDEPEEEKQSIELLVAPKSPVNSIKSADSISNSGSVRSMKKRRAPLPPSMIQNNRQERIASRLEDLRNRTEDGRMKGPAPSPPNPNQISSSPYSNNGSPRVSQETSPKKIIPASPDLLKGLKSPNSVGNSGRKKRRAPPPKRHVAALPEAAIKLELSDLAIKEKEFERQGINLESNIRRLMEEENENDAERIDEMVIQLWSIVNEKNDILRRQTELDYLRRGHRLEEQQAEVEFQLRVLMETPADQRKEDQEETEEQLLQELLKLVDERAEVIEWLDRVTSEILVEPHMNGEEDLHSGQSLSSFSSLSRSSPTSQNLVLPIKSETVTTPESGKFGKSKDTKDKNKEDGKSHKRDKFKLGFFSKKRKSSKSSSKNQDEGKSNDESLKV